MSASRRRKSLRNCQMKKKKRNPQRDPLNPRQLSLMLPKMAKNNQLNPSDLKRSQPLQLKRKREVMQLLVRVVRRKREPRASSRLKVKVLERSNLRLRKRKRKLLLSLLQLMKVGMTLWKVMIQISLRKRRRRPLLKNE